jgi:hypothetical protein
MMADQPIPAKKPTDVSINRAKGRPMLSWVGKKPLGRVTAFPAQHIEQFSAAESVRPLPLGYADWSGWPKDLAHGGLLYHGDNKEVLAHLLAHGFRGQIPDWRAVVDCVLIDANRKGEVFNVTLADVPERKQDLVAGRYELPTPPTGATVAIKVIDMLGEERVILLDA